MNLYTFIIRFLFSIVLIQSSINYSLAQTPVASFTTNPANSFGTVTICQGQQIIFGNTSSNTNVNSTYTWNFGSGASPSTATGIGPHNVVYNSATSTLATLTVSNGPSLNSTSSISIQVNAALTSNLTLVNNTPTFSTTTSGGVTLFRNCSTSPSSLFSLNVLSYPVGTTQTFQWGDGTPNSSQLDIVSNQISHTYNLGEFTLTHTVISPNGCQTVKQYYIFNGDAPELTVSGSGQTTCLPFPYSLDILSNRIPGTNYTVSFTDGSPSSIFSTVNDTTISHVFNTSSCGEEYPVGPITIENSFQATIYAENSCGFTFATVGPITISTGSNAEFSYEPASPICQNEPVTFTNESSAGENVNQDGCSNNYAYYWQLAELTGWTLTSGNMGSSNGYIGGSLNYTNWDTPSVDSVEITFDTPGTYHMWIYTANACGVDSIMHELVINPTASVNVNPVNPEICSGYFSDSIFMVSTIPGYLINWEIADTVNVLGVTTMNGSGVSADTILPIFLTNPTSELGYVVISSTVGCTSVPPTMDTIFVKPQGNLIVNPTDDYICSDEQTDIDISSNLSEATFSWQVSYPSTITGASNASGNNIAQTLFNSGTSIDTAFYTIYIGNVTCPGDSIVVPIAVQPGITLTQLLDTVVCSGAFINPATIVSVPSGAIFSWENDNTAIGLGGSGSGQVPSWTATSNTTGSPISGTITITAILDPSCPGTETDFIVTLNPTGNIDVSTIDTLICSNESPEIDVQSSISSATITWTSNAPSSISGATNGGGNVGTISNVLNNNGSTSSIDTVFYTISISNVQCPDPDVVVSVAVQPQITMNSVSDILVCPGQTINPDDFVTIPSGGTFSWTNDNTEIGIAGSGNGQIATWTAPTNSSSNAVVGYIEVTASLNGCPGVQEQFTVTINPTPDFTYSLNPTTGISCISPNANISGTVIPSGSTLSWSGPGIVSGQGTSNLTVNQPGTYFVLITDVSTGCTSLDSVEMEPPTEINIISTVVQNVTCAGLSNGSISVTTDNSSNVTYSWTPSVGSGSSVSNLSPGTYSVVVSNEDLCSDDKTVSISQPLPITLSMVDSVGSECGESNGLLSVLATGGQGGFTYSWNNGSQGATVSGIDSGDYTVTATDNSGCSLSQVFDLGCKKLIPIVVPQLITPNNDGKNDLWLIQNIEQYPEIKVWVYNRWGNLVYQSQPYQNNWNGYYTEGGNVNGPLPASTYFYLIDTNKKSQDLIKGYLEIQP